MADRKTQGTFFDRAINIQGDKVVLMIALILIMASVLVVSASTSTLKGASRLSAGWEQFIFASVGIIVIFLIYQVRDLKWFWYPSKYLFAFSVFLLVWLAANEVTRYVKFFAPAAMNGEYRVIKCMGFQIHVFEVVKVSMIMYLAWAMQSLEKGGFSLAKKLARLPHLSFLSRPFWQKCMYIYLPMMVVFVLIIADGSNSSAAIVGLIMFLTIVVGGVKGKEIGLVIIGGTAVIGLCFLVYKVSEGEHLDRIGTAVSRFGHDRVQEVLDAAEKGDYHKLMEDKGHNRQPISALVAVSEGGLFGKGAGKSTQKYIVPVMFEDYMFAFIVEEYGLFGAIIVLMLYGSLLARGSIIVRNCENTFAKSAVAGLTLLIALQAMVHIFVNVFPNALTGQTLPILSYGKSSFLVFCGVFGIILAMSRIAKKNIEKETLSIGTLNSSE